MIKYHGTPITPRSALAQLAGHSFCVSFAKDQDIRVCHDIGASVMLDNGAFTLWTRGGTVDWNDYYRWCEPWLDWHTTWAVIPDVIGGTEEENDALIDQWPHGRRGAPVWHTNESLDRLMGLCGIWPKVCIGSSAEHPPNSDAWHRVMTVAMNRLCRQGKVPTWIHGLRMLQFSTSHYPLSSVDSAHIARNHHRDGGPEKMLRDWAGANCDPYWTQQPEQQDLCLP